MPVDLVQTFQALCESRALLWRRFEWEWIGDAVDPLQKWAEANGLVRLIGQDAVQAIIDEAFAEPSDPPHAAVNAWTEAWTESAKQWRTEHPVSPPGPVGPVPASCEFCHPGPCRFPTMCAGFEQNNRWWAKIPANHPFRRGPGHAR